MYKKNVFNFWKTKNLEFFEIVVMVLDQQVSVNCNVSAEVSGVTVQTVCKILMWIYYLIREEALKKIGY